MLFETRRKRCKIEKNLHTKEFEERRNNYANVILHACNICVYDIAGRGVSEM
jgi:hypothetical protein